MSIKAMRRALECLDLVMSHGSAVQQTRNVLQQAIEQAEQDEVKTWNEAIEAAAHKFELFDTWYYDEVQESILRLKK